MHLLHLLTSSQPDHWTLVRSISMFSLIFLVAGLCQVAVSKTVHYKWDITWVTAAPDGFARPVIGINGQWPCPQIDVDVGDRIVVDVYNALGNQSTGLHWHGIHQTGTGYMDGSSGATQCPIVPGGHMTYDFVVCRPSGLASNRMLTRLHR